MKQSLNCINVAEMEGEEMGVGIPIVCTSPNNYVSTIAAAKILSLMSDIVHMDTIHVLCILAILEVLIPLLAIFG